MSKRGTLGGSAHADRVFRVQRAFTEVEGQMHGPGELAEVTGLDGAGRAGHAAAGAERPQPRRAAGPGPRLGRHSLPARPARRRVPGSAARLRRPGPARFGPDDAPARRRAQRHTTPLLRPVHRPVEERRPGTVRRRRQPRVPHFRRRRKRSTPGTAAPWRAPSPSRPTTWPASWNARSSGSALAPATPSASSPGAPSRCAAWPPTRSSTTSSYVARSRCRARAPGCPPRPARRPRADGRRHL